MSYREEELHDGDLELTARAKAHMAAGEPTQAGETVKSSAASVELQTGSRSPSAASPASPAKEVEQSLAVLLAAVFDAAKETKAIARGPSIEWLHKLTIRLHEMGVSLRAPVSSAPRGPSAEAVEPSTESKVIDLMGAIKDAIDHPRVSEDKGV